MVTRMAAKRAPNLVNSLRVSNRRFKDATGWQPAYPSLAEGLPAVYANLEPARAR
jgi:hypothetical protein